MTEIRKLVVSLFFLSNWVSVSSSAMCVKSSIMSNLTHFSHFYEKNEPTYQDNFISRSINDRIEFTWGSILSKSYIEISVPDFHMCESFAKKSNLSTYLIRYALIDTPKWENL